MKKIAFLLIIGLFFSCKNEEIQTIPNVFVDIQINLSNLEYQPLQQIGGFVYVDGGVRGIIVYREAENTYRALERNCSFQPNDDCARVEVDNSLLFIQCPCCSSQFDFDGTVISAPASLPLRRYTTQLQGNFLYITN